MRMAHPQTDTFATPPLERLSLACSKGAQSHQSVIFSLNFSHTAGGQMLVS